jgi:hypothetical protein
MCFTGGGWLGRLSPGVWVVATASRCVLSGLREPDVAFISAHPGYAEKDQIVDSVL